MKAMNVWIAYRLRRDRVTWKKGMRGICKLSYFNSDDMHPIHLLKTKSEAEAWLHKPVHSVPMLTPRFLENL